MKNAFALSIITAVAGIFTVGSAYACPLLPTGVGNTVSVGAIDIFTPGNTGEDTPCGVFSPTGTVSQTASAGLANASAVAAFGVNRGSASAGPFAIDRSPQDGNSAGGTSEWTDRLVITGGTGTGTVKFGEHINGFASLGSDFSFAFVFNNVQVDNLVGCNGFPASVGVCDGSVDSEFTDNFQFTYGTPFLMSGLFDFNAGFDAPRGTATSLDFGSTLILNEVILPDGAELQSESGTSYPIVSADITVPEPSSVLLLGGGLVCLGLARRRKRKSA